MFVSYKAGEIRDCSFYMMPKSLLTNPKYRSLTPLSRECYTILFDKMALSLINTDKYSDETGIYIFFSREAMAELQGVHMNTARKAFKELVECELIEEHQQGFGKALRIYVGHISTDEEVVIPPKPTEYVGDTHKISTPPLQNQYSSNTKSNTKQKDTNSLLRKEVQSTLFPGTDKLVKKEKLSQLELALSKIELASSGRASWSTITNRDFAKFYIEEHNKRFPKPIIFDAYEDVTVMRESLISAFKLPHDKICQYILFALDDYLKTPDRNDKLSFHMLSKSTRMMEDIMGRAKRKIEPVESKYGKSKPMTDEQRNSIPEIF